jgi:MiaB-like tRNA modifying enzyme
LKKKVFFKTFGCRTNIFDTQVMMTNLLKSKVSQTLYDADIIIINSCTVTNSADASIRNYINSIKREFPEKEILFTGCGVLTEGEKLYNKGIIKTIFGHSEKERVEDFIYNENRVFQIGDFEHIDSTIVENFNGKSRAFIKIQEGCNFSCNYCIIPTVRGKSRSYSEKTIIEQVTKLASNGFGEFVLTGTNIGSYQNTTSSLAKLLKKISQIRGVRRVRLGSVEPSQITHEFKEILSEKWLGRYLHIALQYTDNRMLKIMNRKNKLEKDLELFHFISNQGYAIGTDYIVGHPFETEEIFNTAFENLKKFPLTHIHLFRYSVRNGTKSANMKNIIDGKIVKERFKLINNLIKNKAELFKKSINQPLEILFENKRGEFYYGYDQYFFQRSIMTKEDLEGKWTILDKSIVHL